MTGDFFILERVDQVENMAKVVSAKVEASQVVTLQMKVGKTRTSRQQAALEVWCRNLAKFFNDAGITREIRSSIFKEGAIECDWTRASVKDEIWRPVQQVLTEKSSTTEATTVEYAQIYDTLVRAFANKNLQLPPWPIKG